MGERVTIGEVFAFRIPDTGRYGTCQVVDLWTDDRYGELATVAYFRDTFAAPPALDRATGEIFRRTHHSWRGDDEIINVASTRPAGLVLVGTAPVADGVDLPARNSFGTWFSTPAAMPRQLAWDALPADQTRAYREALDSEDRVTVPGLFDADGEPVTRAVRLTSFADDGRYPLPTDFRLTSLATLPAISDLRLHRWFDDLTSVLTSRPTIDQLSLFTHGQTTIDLGTAFLTDLTIDVGGLTSLTVPETLTSLTLVGVPDSLAVRALGDATRITLEGAGPFGGVSGLDGLGMLRIKEAPVLDVTAVADTFPALRDLRVFGAPTILHGTDAVGALPDLDTLWLIECFGFVPGDLEGPFKALTTLMLSSVPAAVTVSARRRFGNDPRIDTTINRARSPEWIAENLDNPLRAWSGRAGISDTAARKAAAAYRTALKAARALGAVRCLDE